MSEDKTKTEQKLLEIAYAIAFEETHFVIMVVIDHEPRITVGPVLDRDVPDVAQELIAKLYSDDEAPDPEWGGGHLITVASMIEWDLWVVHAPDDRALVGTLRYLEEEGENQRYRYVWDTNRAEGKEFDIYIEPMVRWVRGQGTAGA